MTDVSVLIRQLQGRVAALEGAAPTGGIGTVTFTASADSSVVTLPHGFETQPAAVVPAPGNGAGGKLTATLAGLTDTTFAVQMHYTPGTPITGDAQFVWMAIPA